MAAAPPLTIQGEAGTYPIVIRAGALTSDLPEFVSARTFSRAVVVTNDTLAPLYGEALAASLPRGALCVVPDGEQYKTLDTAGRLYGDLLAAGADRSSVVIGLGGGVIGDLAGFVAATYMRGIAFIQAPTSLLAMVDASLGGKVGVDLPQGKNLVGAFKDPLGVFADTAALATLPDDEFRCGLAEIVKAGLINDPALFAHLRLDGPRPIETVIARAVLVKKRLVEQDRLENGPRALLNLGHTFGHAIEHVSRYRWKHGHAVSVGLVAAARLSERRGLCEPGLGDLIEGTLAELNMPTRYSDLDPLALWDVMRHDKKWRGGTAQFIVLEGVGQAVMLHEAPETLRADVLAVLEEVRA